MRAAMSNVLALVLLAMAAGPIAPGCSGSDGSHAPSISDLYLSSPAVVDGAGNAEVWGYVSFRDTGGDVASVTVRSDLGTTTIPVSGAEGVTAGSGSARVTVAPGRYGSFSFEVWLTDRAGNDSNHLSAHASFVPDDGGRNWTQVSALPARALARSSGSSAAEYVAVGAGGLIATSQDGSLWTQQPSPVTSDLHGVAWSGSRFVAVGTSSTILSSEDGYAWTLRAVPVPDTDLYAVSWGGGAFVAVGGGVPGPVALRSGDGASWTSGTGLEPNAYLTPLRDAAWGSGRWVAVGQERWASADGETWARAPVDYTQLAGFVVAWNGARFVTAGVQVGVSADGLSWTTGMSEMPPGYPATGLAWSGYHWLLLGTDAVSTSADATDWSSAPLPTTSPMSPSKVIWDGDWYPARYLAAVGTGIWTSP